MQKKGYATSDVQPEKRGSLPRARHCECKSEIKRGRMQADNLFEKKQAVSHALSVTLCVRRAYTL